MFYVFATYLLDIQLMTMEISSCVFLLILLTCLSYFTDPGTADKQVEEKEDGILDTIPVFDTIPKSESLDLDKILLEEPRKVAAELHRGSTSSKQQKGEV